MYLHIHFNKIKHEKTELKIPKQTVNALVFFFDVDFFIIVMIYDQKWFNNFNINF